MGWEAAFSVVNEGKVLGSHLLLLSFLCLLKPSRHIEILVQHFVKCVEEIKV